MRFYSWRRGVLWAVVAAGIVVAYSPLSAQDWFRQRTHDGKAAPVTIDMARKTIDGIQREVTITPAPPTPRVFPATIPTPIPSG